jgi:hypothetical protein
MSGLQQAPGVIVKAEDRRTALGLVGPDTLEYPHSVVQGMGQDMGSGLTPGNKFTVKPDNAITIGETHQ